MANYEVLEPGGHSALVDGLKGYADRAGGTGAEQIANGSVNMDKLDDDVLDELDSKAYADGYYAQLTAGAADNLTARGDAVNAEYLYRTAGGTADIENGQATIKSIHGNTLVWNQLNVRVNSAQQVEGLTRTVNADGSLTITGTVTTAPDYGILYLGNSFSLKRDGRKYLFKASKDTGLPLRVNGYPATAETRAFIWSNNAGGTWNGTLSANVAVGDTVNITNTFVNVFDLTQMFGAGNEPSTVAEFEALFPEPYYEYDAGSLLSVNIEGIETVGFNQWDEEWEVGAIDGTTGQNVSSSSIIRSKNYIPVFPGVTYYFKCGFHAGHSSNPSLRFYDADKNFIGIYAASGAITPTNSEFTVPDNAHYLRFNMQSAYGATYQNDIAINLSWSGRRNGEYEAFWKSHRLIDVATYFPDGMRSVEQSAPAIASIWGVSVYDELTATEAIQRVGVVDLGTLTWRKSSNTTVDRYVCDMPSNSIYNYAAVKCAEYPYTQGVNAAGTNYPCVFSNAGQICFNFAEYETTTVEQFKTAMSGVLLFYALATPVTTPIDPVLNLSYKVDDWGTEEIVVPEGERSAPPTLEIAYGLNAVDFIRRAPSQYISHDSHDNFVDALEAEMGVTVTETFDDTDNAYEYSIAPTDGMTLAQAKENLRGLLDLVQGTIGSVTDWSEIAEMASHGSSFLVGTQFQTTYKSAADGTEYEMPWDVMHFETATVKGGSSVAGVYLESHYALPFATMFDQFEAFYAVPSGGLAAGTYSITFGNTSAWGQVPANSTYNFTLANSYSQGAQLCFNRSIYSYAPDTCSVQAFATQGATTASETVAVSAGSAGTSLGTIGTAQVTDSSDLNHLHRIGLGSGRWMTSALRQWLNTDADGGTWWVPQTKWDRPPSYASYDGFLKGLDPDLVSAMREVRVVTAQSYSADGGTAAAPVTDVTYDKVFLPSWEQQYLAVSQNYGGSAGLEGSAWDYWKLAAGTASPRPASTSGNESTYTTAYVRYGMENHGTARHSWLRSAYRYSGSSPAVVYSSGNCGNNGASYGIFAAPACFIG